MKISSRTRLTAIIAVLLILSTVSLLACSKDSESAAPKAGGVVISEESGPMPAMVEDIPMPAAPAVVLAVGQKVIASRDTSVYTRAAATAPVMEVYDAGSEFVVMEPSADFEAYPVYLAGASWVRVRAADGLAGWARTDTLAN